MKLKLNLVSAAVSGALLSLTASFVYAQTSAPQKVEKIEVTGSNIKRIQAEGAVPVETISRKDIEKKGVTSTNELLRSLAYMSSVNDELVSNSPNTSGSASAGFRGLSGDQTVVLLNGRRLANYGFDGAFVNLNSIPLGAIERVEILKDGAAAIYGADAIGGVINFITRKDYTGVELSASYGQSSRKDGDETNFSATGGWGNLSKDKFNVLANFNYFKRDPINNLDRDRTKSADFRPFGGTNQLSTFAPSGNFVNPTTGLQSPFQPCPAGLSVSPSPLTPGSVGSASCLFDFAPYRTTLYGTERTGGLVSGRFAVNENTTVFGEFMFSKSDTFTSAAPSPGNFTLAAGNPSNPFPSAITVRGRPLQAGPRTTDNRAEATRIVAGIEGAINNFEYTFAVGEAKNKATNKDGGYFLLNLLNPAIANGTFNPFSLTNPATIINAISSSDTRIGETTNTFVEGKVAGEIMQLPAGALGIAAGVVFGKEEIADLPGPNQRRGNVFGSIQQSTVEANRNLSAAFIEFAAPITRDLEAQIALRHDRYDGGVRSTTPKFAVRYQPIKSLLLRASYSEGFKMPSLRDLFGGLNQSADSVQDFPGCAARNVPRASCPRLQYDRFSGGNTLLKPEKAKSSNLGIVFEPTQNTSIGIDYFSINKTNEIGLVLAQFVIDNVAYTADTTTTLGGNAAFSVTRNAGGTITSLNTSLGNLGERRIRGFDFSTNNRWKVADTSWSFASNTTYYAKYDYADQPGTPLYGRLGLLNLPRWKSTFSLGASYQAWDANLAYTTMGKMADKQQSTAATPVASTDRVIGNFNTVDLGLAYTGFNNIKITGNVKNLLDREPPFSSNDGRTLGFAQVHDIRGRYFQIAANYKF